MKSILKLVFCVAALGWPVVGAVADSGRDLPKIYDESADGARQIGEAVRLAAKEHKRVLLMFGANWCIWCHRLHDTFEKDAGVAAELRQGYELVLIDTDKEHNKSVDEKYGHPTKFGLPVLVVLDSAGKQLTIEDSSKLEEGDHHSPAKILNFLQTAKWP